MTLREPKLRRQGKDGPLIEYPFGSFAGTSGGRSSAWIVLGSNFRALHVHTSGARVSIVRQTAWLISIYMANCVIIVLIFKQTDAYQIVFFWQSIDRAGKN